MYKINLSISFLLHYMYILQFVNPAKQGFGKDLDIRVLLYDW